MWETYLEATHESAASNSAFAKRFSAPSCLLVIFQSRNDLLMFRAEKANLTIARRVTFVKLLPGHNLT